MSIDKTAKMLLEAMQNKPKPEAYDTPATVTRVEGNTLWVHIPGGVDETPVKKTIGASVGDEIQIRVGGGQAWAVGNSTAPPTDDTRAEVAIQAVQAEQMIRETKILAEQDAREAAIKALAEALESSSGMHITTETPSGGGTIYYLHDKEALAESGVVLKLTAEALGISTDGGITYPYGVNFATGTTITNILQANGIDADWINAGTLLSTYIRLCGFMEVYEDTTLSASGGQLGFCVGSNSFGDGMALQKLVAIENPGILGEMTKGSAIVAGENAAFLGHTPGTLHLDGGGVDVFEAQYPISVKLDDDGMWVKPGVGNGVNVYDSNGYGTYSPITKAKIDAWDDLLDTVGLATYSSVTDLDLTSGSATIAGAYAALPVKSILTAPGTDFSSSEVPYTTGFVKMVKSISNARGSIEYFGKTEAQARYEMFVDTSTYVPTGTWRRVITSPDATTYGMFSRSTHTVISAQSIAANDGVSGTVTFSKSGYYPLAIAGWTASGSGSTYVIPMRLYLSAASSGSATVGYYFRNFSTTPAISSATVTVHILWVSTS